ncbi:MAG: methyltransferase [Myxococcales bacterium]|nr:methyltransferase [Myxococcales bacterium]
MSEPVVHSDESLDTMLRGHIRLLQSKKGYRTSVDAMLVAWFAWTQAPQARRAADFGAGSGLVAITLARALPALQMHLIERQDTLVARARRNLIVNRVTAPVTQHDFASGPVPGLYDLDLVVSNPPFYAHKGRVAPPHPERRDAHYESTAGVEAFCTAAAAALKPDGLLCMVYPSEGADRLVAAFAGAGLGRMRLCALHHRSLNKPATRVLLAGQRGPLDVVTLPRMRLHPEDALDHTYIPEVENFLAELGNY